MWTCYHQQDPEIEQSQHHRNNQFIFESKFPRNKVNHSLAYPYATLDQRLVVPSFELDIIWIQTVQFSNKQKKKKKKRDVKKI